QRGVLADPRHRGVAGDAGGGHREAEDALLGAANPVATAPAVLEDRAATLVYEQVAANLLGMVMCDPFRPQLAAGLLVDDRHDQQLAARRTPPRARQRDRGGDLGGDLRLHVQRAAPPDAAVRDIARRSEEHTSELQSQS